MVGNSPGCRPEADLLGEFSALEPPATGVLRTPFSKRFRSRTLLEAQSGKLPSPSTRSNAARQGQRISDQSALSAVLRNAGTRTSV